MPARLRIEELESPTWLKQKYSIERLTAEEIGNLLGCSKNPVLNKLEEFGIPKREVRPHISSLLYRDEAWLREQYFERGLSTKDIGAICCVDRGTIQKWMKHYKIPFNERANQLCKNDPGWLREKYLEEGLSAAKIGNLAGVERCTILRWLEKHDVPRRHTPPPSKYAQYRNKEWLLEQYVKKELSTYEIADGIGCCFQTVCEWLDEFDIPRRDWVAHLRSENCESSWNDKFFDELTTDGAYIIGMIIADGSISTEQYVIQIVQKDRRILDKISSVMSGGNFHQMSNAWQVSFNSKHAREIMTDKFGIPNGKQKSYTVRIPDCILERDDLVSHCIRGIFDGDGFVRKGGSHFEFCSGSLGLLSDIANVLTRLISLPAVELNWVPGGYIKKNGERSGAYNIEYGSVLDAIDFARFIYGPDLECYGSNLYLERKKERFQSSCDRWRGRDWLCEQIKSGKTNEDIAIELNVSVHRVAKVLNGIGVHDFPYKDSEWLRAEFVNKGRSVYGIADDYGVRSDAILYYVNKYGLMEERSGYWNQDMAF